MLIETCYGAVERRVVERAAQIKLLICDVDGVLSDGLIYMGNQGEELKAFHVRDPLPADFRYRSRHHHRSLLTTGGRSRQNLGHQPPVPRTAR
jgi:hypothetical protein